MGKRKRQETSRQVCVCLYHELLVDSHWRFSMSVWESCLSTGLGGQQASRDGGREENKRSEGLVEGEEGREGGKG